jgi:predicted alpha/beta-fold hydrolase
MESFRPVPWLPGRHLETIVPAFWPAPDPEAPISARLVGVAEGAAVEVRVCEPPGGRRGTLLLVHGIGGSSESGYMKRTASMALSRGWIVARMNCRNCGGTEALSNTLYNAGQSEDVGHVLADLLASGLPRPVCAIGFSLGGSLVLRHAGRSGAECLADAVVGVNPPVDLEASCLALERPHNVLYHTHFTLSLLRLLRRIRSVRRLPGPVPRFHAVRTLRRLDATWTAPDAGYATAEEYYRGASAGPHLAGITVPGLVLSSGNDPIVPLETFEPYRGASPRLAFVHPARGGHLGYWQAGASRFWAAERALGYLDETCPG